MISKAKTQQFKGSEEGVRGHSYITLKQRGGVDPLMTMGKGFVTLMMS